MNFLSTDMLIAVLFSLLGSLEAFTFDLASLSQAKDTVTSSEMLALNKSSDQQQADDFCKGKGNGYYAPPENMAGNKLCNKYYWCNNGASAGGWARPVETCSGGLRWDAKGAAKHKGRVHCVSKFTVDCPTDPNESPGRFFDCYDHVPGYYAAPYGDNLGESFQTLGYNTDCRGYYNCDHGHESGTKCSKNERVDPALCGPMNQMSRSPCVAREADFVCLDPSKTTQAPTTTEDTDIDIGILGNDTSTEAPKTTSTEAPKTTTEDTDIDIGILGNDTSTTSTTSPKGDVGVRGDPHAVYYGRQVTFQLPEKHVKLFQQDDCEVFASGGSPPKFKSKNFIYSIYVRVAGREVLRLDEGKAKVLNITVDGMPYQQAQSPVRETANVSVDGLNDAHITFERQKVVLGTRDLKMAVKSKMSKGKQIPNHLDFFLQEGLNSHKATGVLPELWGLQPLSDAVRQMVKEESMPSFLRSSRATLTGAAAQDLSDLVDQ